MQQASASRWNVGHPMTDEELLCAKLMATEPTPEGRVIRALLAVVAGSEPGMRFPCDCGIERDAATLPHEHSNLCTFRVQARNWPMLAKLEWGMHNNTMDALKEVIGAVDAEVALHPGMHDRLHTAMTKAKDVVRYRGDSRWPGHDADLPF